HGQRGQQAADLIDAQYSFARDYFDGIRMIAVGDLTAGSALSARSVRNPGRICFSGWFSGRLVCPAMQSHGQASGRGALTDAFNTRKKQGMRNHRRRDKTLQNTDGKLLSCDGFKSWHDHVTRHEDPCPVFLRKESGIPKSWPVVPR
ncbi:MAG: hypothetical protein WAU91_17005, partial [Desulfatitalea sp.]